MQLTLGKTVFFGIQIYGLGHVGGQCHGWNSSTTGDENLQIIISHWQAGNNILAPNEASLLPF